MINVGLNIPLFMDGCAQLSADEVLEGCKIASLRRAISRIKNLNISKGTLPNTLTRIANQIVAVSL